LNVPQELVMPEGDRSFKGILERIQQVAEAVPVPVIVKEVGFGMCVETYKQLQAAGVKIADVGGRGGTNFIQIENQRRSSRDYSYLSGWGQSTAISLLEATGFMGMELIASGGIRHPLDMAKCLALGACAVGTAGPILKILTEEGIQGAIETILSWQDQLRAILLLLGAKTPHDLRSVPLVVTGRTKEWCDLRGVTLEHLARRTKNA
jgi:isopentenyl-diphosphate delta-isomerase